METSYKRVCRELPDETKEKISKSLQGKAKSASHAQAISNGMKQYWSTVPATLGFKSKATDADNKKSNSKSNEM